MSDAPSGTEDVVAHLFDAAYRRLVVQLHGVRGDPVPEATLQVAQDELLISLIADGAGVVDVSRDAGVTWQRLLAR